MADKVVSIKHLRVEENVFFNGQMFSGQGFFDLGCKALCLQIYSGNSLPDSSCIPISLNLVLVTHNHSPPGIRSSLKTLSNKGKRQTDYEGEAGVSGGLGEGPHKGLPPAPAFIRFVRNIIQMSDD